MFGQFLRETGAGKHADFVVIGQHFFDDFKGQPTAVQFKTLAGGEYRQAAAAVLLEQLDAAAQADDGGNRQHQFATLQRFADIGVHAQVFRQPETGQIALVFADFLHGAGVFGIVRPHGDTVAVQGKMDGQCAAPCAGAQYGYVHAVLAGCGLWK